MTFKPYPSRFKGMIRLSLLITILWFKGMCRDRDNPDLLRSTVFWNVSRHTMSRQIVAWQPHSSMLRVSTYHVTHLDVLHRTTSHLDVTMLEIPDFPKLQNLPSIPKNRSPIKISHRMTGNKIPIDSQILDLGLIGMIARVAKNIYSDNGIGMW